MSEAREAADAADVVAHAELTEIKIYEISGRRIAEPIDGSESLEDFQIRATGDLRHLETRARLSMMTAEAEFLVDAGVIYEFDEDLKIGQAVAREFIERVSIMAVYPFVREQIFSTASRLGVPAPVLGLLRAGQFTVNTDQAPDVTAGITAEPLPNE